jgi:hypothetical protein
MCSCRGEVRSALASGPLLLFLPCGQGVGRNYLTRLKKCVRFRLRSELTYLLVNCRAGQERRSTTTPHLPGGAWRPRRKPTAAAVRHAPTQGQAPVSSKTCPVGQQMPFWIVSFRNTLAGYKPGPVGFCLDCFRTSTRTATISCACNDLIVCAAACRCQSQQFYRVQPSDIREQLE